MLFRMSDDQKTPGEPAVIISAPQTMNGETEVKKGRLTKKHVVIAVIALFVTGLIVIGVLVGIKIYTDSNLEVLKYTLQANGLSQNASVDGNSVMYHVKRDDGAEAWIVQDFDKGIQVTKYAANGNSACYVTALNRSIATDASSIPDTAPDTLGRMVVIEHVRKLDQRAPSTASNARSWITDGRLSLDSNGDVKSKATSGQVMYTILPDAIVDLSFLGKKASAMCQNIPTHHAVPDCGKSGNMPAEADNSTAVDHRSERGAIGACSSYYYYGRRLACACGCCLRACASIAVYWVKWYDYSTRLYYCTFYMYGSWFYYYLNQPYCFYNGVSYN